MSIALEILLINEVFSMGDEGFQKKNKQIIARLIPLAKIIILASPERSLIDTHCNKIFHFESCKVEIKKIPGSAIKDGWFI
jgi:ABC-type polysaccharide/polyol phosphate transport system ATPase subunit